MVGQRVTRFALMLSIFAVVAVSTTTAACNEAKHIFLFQTSRPSIDVESLRGGLTRWATTFVTDHNVAPPSPSSTSPLPSFSFVNSGGALPPPDWDIVMHTKNGNTDNIHLFLIGTTDSSYSQGGVCAWYNSLFGHKAYDVKGLRRELNAHDKNLMLTSHTIISVTSAPTDAETTTTASSTESPPPLTTTATTTTTTLEPSTSTSTSTSSTSSSTSPTSQDTTSTTTSAPTSSDISTTTTKEATTTTATESEGTTGSSSTTSTSLPPATTEDSPSPTSTEEQTETSTTTDSSSSSTTQLTTKETTTESTTLSSTPATFTSFETTTTTAATTTASTSMAPTTTSSTAEEETSTSTTSNTHATTTETTSSTTTTTTSSATTSTITSATTTIVSTTNTDTADTTSTQSEDGETTTTAAPPTETSTESSTTASTPTTTTTTAPLAKEARWFVASFRGEFLFEENKSEGGLIMHSKALLHLVLNDDAANTTSTTTKEARKKCVVCSFSELEAKVAEVFNSSSARILPIGIVTPYNGEETVANFSFYGASAEEDAAKLYYLSPTGLDNAFGIASLVNSAYAENIIPTPPNPYPTTPSPNPPKPQPNDGDAAKMRGTIIITVISSCSGTALIVGIAAYFIRKRKLRMSSRDFETESLQEYRQINYY